MEPSNNETPTFGTPTDMSRFIEGHDRVGILVTGEVRAALFDSLTELLAREKRRIVRILDSDHLAVLRQSFGDLPTPIPTPTARTSAEWRDVLVAGLREEQQSAQERVAAAKAIEVPIDPFDRDVSSWLAAGLRDLFDDPITAASFLIEGKGIFARLAAGVTEVRFAESDFLRPDGIRFLEAGRPAQSMLTKLTLASTSQYRVAAARLLNRVLEQINLLSATGFQIT